MVPSTFTLSSKFTDTIDIALTDARWDGHDATIKGALGAFTNHLKSTLGYSQPDFKIIKAMLWTESGGPDNPSKAWATKPLQIGVPGDPGLGALLSKTEHGDLILPLALKSSITVLTAKSDPKTNIQAAIGYLLMRHAKFAFVNVEDGASMPFDYIVRSGDNLEKIARRNATTVEEIRKLNPKKSGILKPKDVLRLRNARMEWQVSGWAPVTTGSAETLYNGGGDKVYADKLNYCIDVMNRMKR